jgi:hypothetical protein
MQRPSRIGGYPGGEFQRASRFSSLRISSLALRSEISSSPCQALASLGQFSREPNESVVALDRSLLASFDEIVNHAAGGERP